MRRRLAKAFHAWRAALDTPGWRNFFIAMGALAIAMAMALYSAAVAQAGRVWAAGISAIGALALSGWVALTIVPALARRTALRWLAYHIDYKLTREGVVYIIGVFAIAIAALNTGNNLLFIILACLLAGIIVSGVVSSVVLAGVGLKLDLPEHIFAAQPVLAALELENEKYSLPSLSLRVEGDPKKLGVQIFSRPVYFPYIPRQTSARQQVELLFPLRGVWRQDAFNVRTRFPFGFLEKTRKVESALEIVVYPPVEPADEFFEILPLLSGELESFLRGRGHDLYSIRDAQPQDSARFVDWKASAKTAALKVREFAREDERRVEIVFDPFRPASAASDAKRATWADEEAERFERGVRLAACLAWHFYESDAEMAFRTDSFAASMAPAGDIIYGVLRELAFVQPKDAHAGAAKDGGADGGAGAAARAQDGGSFLSQLAADSETFKIIITSQPRGSIPTSLWSSSYFIFLPSL